MLPRCAAAVVVALTRFLVGGHARWQGCAPIPGQRIYFANHASHLDTIVLWAALPRHLRPMVHPVAARDYWGKTPLRRFIALRMLNAVLVDRDCGREALAPMQAVLAKGHSLILFPEGTRGSERLPGPLKGGLFAISRDFPEAALVPVYLTNLARAYPKGAIIPAPLICIASFGAPMPRIEAEAKRDFLGRARAAICELAEGTCP